MAAYTSSYPATTGPYGGSQYSQVSPHHPVKSALPRTISTTNLQITQQCQDYVRKDMCNSFPSGGTCFFMDLPGYTFTIPNLADYPPDFRKFVFDRIIDNTVKMSLEEERCLNWFVPATKLEPLNTQGDGNCLLHAASLGMWGFQDRDLILRKAVSQAVIHAAKNTNTLYIRWKYNKEQECKQQGYMLEAAQWQREWNTMVQQASPEPTATNTLHSLEEFHVFVLANVLRRPVIMYASRKMRSFHSGGTMQSINFHGVYLPLLWHPNGCKKDPLPLSYQNGHFSALVVVDSMQQYRDGKLILPLAGSDGLQLPVRFTLSNENEQGLLSEYLSVVHVPNPHGQYPVPCAALNMTTRPVYYDRLVGAFINACYSAFSSQQPTTQPYYQTGYSAAGGMVSSQGVRYQSPSTAPVYSTASTTDQNPSSGQPERLKCINSCGQYGDPKTAGLCSKCHERTLAAILEHEIPSATPTSSVNNTAPIGMSGPTSIKCPNCSKPGHPKYLGMCENCYGVSQSVLQQPQSQPRPYQGDQSHTQPQYGNQTYAQSQYRNEAYTQPQYGNQHCTQPQYGQYQTKTQPVYGNEPGSQPQYGNQEAKKQEHPYESLDHYQKPTVSLPKLPQEPPPPPVPLPRSTASPEERKQCRTPNCSFFGTEQTRYYCSKCFEQNMPAIFQETDKSPQAPASPPAPDLRPSSQPVQTYIAPQPDLHNISSQHATSTEEPEKCTWCHDYYGSPMYGGLCHGCFKKSTEMGSTDKKCPVCQEFYGSEQQRGLCNGCFLKQTEVEAHGTTRDNQPAIQGGFSPANLPPADYSISPQPPPPKPTSNPLPPVPTSNKPYFQARTLNTNHIAPAYLQASDFKLMTEPQNPVPTHMDRPIPKPRARPRTSVNTSATTNDPTSVMRGEMAAINISKLSTPAIDCFMCSGKNPGPSKFSSLCPKHTEMVVTMSTSRSTNTDVKHSTQPPPTTHATTTQAPNNLPYQYPRGTAVQQAHNIPTYGHTTSQHQTQDYNVNLSAQATNTIGLQTANQTSHQQLMPPQHYYQQGTKDTQPAINYPGSQHIGHSGSSAMLNDFNTNQGGSGVPAQQEEMISVGVGIHSAQAHGAMPGLATGTSSAARGSDVAVPKEKLLCKTAGCSFYAVPALNNLCQDCYKENYDT